jgi:hypothetical protein
VTNTVAVFSKDKKQCNAQTCLTLVTSEENMQISDNLNTFNHPSVKLFKNQPINKTKQFVYRG